MFNSRHELDAWEACYPHASRRLTPQSAIPTLERVLGVSQALAVYRISESQWLLLYECLENYCAELNDIAPGQPDGVLPVGDFQLAEIDFDSLVALYFWDTDFLMPPGESKPVWPAGSRGAGLTEDLGEFARGWRADSDEMHVEKVEDPAWIEGEAPCFRPGAHRYPDWDDGAEF